MRAVCDACSTPQPAHWRAGDLCAHCGAAVRVDVRCFWCAKWTPSSGGAKYCRTCGGELVTPQQYGPARMLKDAGADRFTVPKMLKELDPAQIENFSRIYQRHAVAVARHVDELQLLEKYLRQSVWSADLEEELIPQLPWPEAMLAKMQVPAKPWQPPPPSPRSEPRPPPTAEQRTVLTLEASTPFPRTRQLAALARVRLEDWSAVQAAAQVFLSADAGSPLQWEAALTLSSWKIAPAVGYLREDRALLQALQAATDAPPALTEAIRVGRATLGEKDVDGLRDALSSSDPDLAFGSALVLGDLDRLAAALSRSHLERIAAGKKLIQAGQFGGIAEALRTSPIEVQMELVDELRRTKKPLPQLADALMQLYETTPNPRLCVRCNEVLCRELNPDWVPRLLARAGTEIYIYQSLFSEAAALPPAAVAQVGAFMIGNGRFRMSQYGLPEAARRGALTDTFVPAHFLDGATEVRCELLRCAEEQLKVRGDETLHRFVMNTLFGPYDAKTRSAAWWALSRWYVSQKYGWKGPFQLSTPEVTRFFGSIGAFLPKCTALLTDGPSMHEVGVFEFIADLLGSATPDFVTALTTESALQGATHEWVKALLFTLSSDYWPKVRSDAAGLLGKIGAHPAWRDEVVAGLQARLADPNFDFTYYCKRSLNTITGQPND